MIMYSMISLPPNDFPKENASRRPSHLPGRRIGARLGGRGADDEVGWEGGARQLLGLSDRRTVGHVSHGPFGTKG